ncbi:hypothetical protein RhiirA4_453557 [Rhizophagus irregularis]|uniref:HMG box domain-containing protein n=1 Tax=Rhizophagus irregularis TaxID=588596 RepID=A0A2I1G0Q9_9GLOM|nr:hypothetical protein RhiirA4_453557 [Rhizophagus irregularis]
MKSIRFVPYTIEKSKRKAGVFIFYRNEMLKEYGPIRIQMTAFSKMMSEKWNSLSENEKELWRQKHALSQYPAEQIPIENEYEEPAPVIIIQNPCQICGYLTTTFQWICNLCFLNYLNNLSAEYYQYYNL